MYINARKLALSFLAPSSLRCFLASRYINHLSSSATFSMCEEHLPSVRVSLSKFPFFIYGCQSHWNRIYPVTSFYFFKTQFPNNVTFIGTGVRTSTYFPREYTISSIPWMYQNVSSVDLCVIIFPKLFCLSTVGMYLFYIRTSVIQKVREMIF